jgi:hypothetical protein
MTADTPTASTSQAPAGPANVAAAPTAAIASEVPAIRRLPRAAMTPAQVKPPAISGTAAG